MKKITLMALVLIGTLSILQAKTIIVCEPGEGCKTIFVYDRSK